MQFSKLGHRLASLRKGGVVAKVLPSLISAYTWLGGRLAALKIFCRLWWSRLEALPTERRRQLGLAVVALVVAIAGLGYVATAPNCYEMLVNGQRIALVQDRAEAEKALAAFLLAQGKKLGVGEVSTVHSISFNRVRADQSQITPNEELPRIFEALVLGSRVCGIAVNGKVEVVLKDEAEAQQALAKLKEAYLPGGGNIQVQEVRFEEKVEVVPHYAVLRAIMSVDEAVKLLQTGASETKVYVVKPGDSLWSIARANGMWPEDLRKANPQLTSERIDIGDKLNLVKPKPLVHVVARYVQTVTQPIPYSTDVRKDDSLWRGQQKIVQAGQEGVKEIKYQVTVRNGVQVSRTVLAENTLKEPVAKIVSQGTKIMLASRSGGSWSSGSGVLAWPIRGAITSGYGSRWGGFHSGIDIDGFTGQAVHAAASGVVVYAGWGGGYGQMVVIDHGGGLVTRYAHLSAISVRAGQRVSRGQVIGAVGATGNATGSHLHFEVLEGGSYRNPLNYLS